MEFGKPDVWDYKAHQVLIAKINALTIRGVPLRDAFEIGGYNAWQWYQGLLFESIKWRVVDGVTPSYDLLSYKRMLYEIAKLKIFFYISLLGFLGALIRRPKALLYSIDLKNSRFKGDQRITPVYDAFLRTHTRFVECFHVGRGRKTFYNWIGRGRLSLYLEGIDAFFLFWSMLRQSPMRSEFAAIDFSSIPERDRPLAQKVVRNLIYRIELSKMRIRVFRRIFRALRLQKIFLIDDPRHFWELIAAGKAEGIETIALEHGHYTRYQLGLFQFPQSRYPYLSPDMLLVWSEYWKHELEKYHSVFSNITVAGYKSPIPDEVHHRPIGEKLRVLVPYESVAPKEAVRTYLKLLSADPTVSIVFKPRPDSSVDEQIRDYVLNSDLVTVLEALPKNPRDVCDIAIGTYTTLLSELVMQGVPVALLETPMDYGDGLVENGIAGRLQFEPVSSLTERLRVLAAIDPAEIARRRTVITGNANQMMADEIVRILR